MTATLWAWYLTARYDLKDVVALIRQAIGVTALASLVVAVGAPAIGGEDPIGPAGWRGIFATKNDLGIAMAIGSVTYFYTLVAGRKNSRLSCFRSSVSYYAMIRLMLRRLTRQTD